jgi:hypothetical protein
MTKSLSTMVKGIRAAKASGGFVYAFWSIMGACVGCRGIRVYCQVHVRN